MTEPAQRPITAPGAPIWADLATTVRDRAVTFYGDVLGVAATERYSAVVQHGGTITDGPHLVADLGAMVFDTTPPTTDSRSGSPGSRRGTRPS